MINLITGINPVSISLRESMPSGSTSSNFKFTFIYRASNETKVFYPTDLTLDSKWSNFNIGLCSPTQSEDLSSSLLDMRDGQWDYIVELDSEILEQGKVSVKHNVSESWNALSRPDINTVVLKR